MTDSGDLDQQLVFEAESATPDGMGGSSISWSTVATVFAEMRPITARELGEAEQQFAPTRYRATIRRRTDITAAQRAKWATNGDEILNIREIHDPGQRAGFMTLILETNTAV